MLDVPTAFDSLDTRCPRLGGAVTFLYCRKVAEGLPCPKSILCWEAAFPVMVYMQKILTAEEWREVFEKTPRMRLDTVLEAAGRADRGTENK